MLKDVGLMEETSTAAEEIPSGMDIPNRILMAAQRLREGHRVNRITVRDFLGHFGVERRGAIKVGAIRRILDSLDLETEPDFGTIWIDEPIRLRLKDGASFAGAAQLPIIGSEDEPQDTSVEEVVLEGTPSAVEQAVRQSESAPTSAEPEAEEVHGDPRTFDPIFRIGSLPAANTRLIVVNRDAAIGTAIGLMVQHKFSQLPVMQGVHEVRGVVTWRSIACWQVRNPTKSPMSGRVGECREDARIVDATRTLFDAIPTIEEHGYVLVRQRDRKISGIVTSSRSK